MRLRLIDQSVNINKTFGTALQLIFWTFIQTLKHNSKNIFKNAMHKKCMVVRNNILILFTETAQLKHLLCSNYPNLVFDCLRDRGKWMRARYLYMQRAKITELTFGNFESDTEESDTDHSCLNPISRPTQCEGSDEPDINLSTNTEPLRSSRNTHHNFKIFRLPSW